MTTADMRLRLELYAVLQDVGKHEALTLAGERLIYRTGDPYAFMRTTGVRIDPGQIHRILLKLQEMGAFTVEELPPQKALPIEDAPLIPSFKYYLAVIRPAFEELTALYQPPDDNQEVQSQPTSNIGLKLRRRGRELILVSPDGDIVINTFRDDMLPERLMKYLFQNPNTTVLRSTLRRDGYGLEGITDISETLRRAGFKRALKRAFVDVCKADRVQFTLDATVSPTDYQEILRELR